MSVFQILDASVRMYRENFALFVAITSLPTIPLQLAQVGIFTFFLDVMQSTPMQRADDQLGVACTMLAVWFALSVLQWGLANPLATGAMTVAMTNRYLGNDVSVGSSFRPVLGRLVPFLGTSMLLNLMLGGALIGGFFTCGAALILFGFLWVWFLFTPCVMVIEGAKGTAAMSRSKQLGTGHGWRILGASAVVFIIYIAFVFVLPAGVGNIIANRFHSPILQQVVQQTIQIMAVTLLDPMWSVLRIMLYFDMRIRKEGYDLALAAHRLGGASPLAA